MRTHIYQFWESLMNTIRWLPIIWKDRHWDHLKKLMDKEEKMYQRDIEYLFKHLNKNIRRWWD